MFCDNYLEILSQSDILCGMGWSEIQSAMECFCPHVRQVDRGNILVEKGSLGNTIYIVLEGELKAFFDCYTNRDNMVEKLRPPQSFG